MTREDIANLRLQAQHIVQADFKQPAAVVRHMLAMQAQDYTGALWAVGLRSQNSTQTDVEKAILEHTIVRTWPMRGTLHFLHADDAHWMVQLLAQRATAAASSRRLALGLTDKVMAEAEAVVRTELAGGKAKRRDELMKLLAGKVKGVAVGNSQAGHIFRNFGEQGITCFGPHDGKQPTFALLDDWLPQTAEKDRVEALGELAKRYFASHGPAQLTDLANWAGITVGDARNGLELARTELETIVVAGTTYYLPRNLEPAKGPSAFLLPGFDEYLLGYKDRSAVLPAKHANMVVPGKNGMFLPTIVINGQVVGTWKKQVKKTARELIYSPFDGGGPLPEIRLSRAARRYQSFSHA